MFNGIAYGDEKKAKDARLWASIILPGTEWKGTKIVMQGGVIQPDGTELYRVPTTVTGKDGKTYYSLGGEIRCPVFGQETELIPCLVSS